MLPLTRIKMLSTEEAVRVLSNILEKSLASLNGFYPGFDTGI
jgi:hypothetical protein